MVILYTIDCPKCRVIEEKLTNANIKFEVCKDRAKMLALGLDFLPALKIDDGSILNFGEAVKWIRGQM